MQRLSPSDSAAVSELAAHLGLSQRKLEVAVQAAESLTLEEFALVEALLRLGSLEIEQRRIMAHAILEALRQYQIRDLSDPLAGVDDEIEDQDALSAVLWADLETRTNRAELLRECVSAEEAGKLTGRSRQAVERQRRAGRLVALRVGRQWRYPAWQFEADAPGGVVPGLDQVLEHLRMSPAGVAVWLTRPRPELDGETPIRLLRSRQPGRVVQLAEQHGYLP